MEEIKNNIGDKFVVVKNGIGGEAIFTQDEWIILLNAAKGGYLGEILFNTKLGERMVALYPQDQKVHIIANVVPITHN